MAHPPVSQNFFGLVRNFKRLNGADPLMRCLAPRLTRSFASTTEIPVDQTTQHEAGAAEIIQHMHPGRTPSNTATPLTSPVLTTLYSWPNLEPRAYATYSPKLLSVPLRRDILHRAVTYEADNSRQGTASTKHRREVHGSNRKILPQKGTGQARAGDKKSPTRRGGGVAFGPKPRDFGTDLNGKEYDLAFRTALSHRYRKGELLVLASPPEMGEEHSARWLHNIFVENQWGRKHGRTLIVSGYADSQFFDCMADVSEHGKARSLDDVDVKDLLGLGRVVIDYTTLDELFAMRSRDLHGRVSPFGEVFDPLNPLHRPATAPVV